MFSYHTAVIEKYSTKYILYNVTDRSRVDRFNKLCEITERQYKIIVIPSPPPPQCIFTPVLCSNIYIPPPP